MPSSWPTRPCPATTGRGVKPSPRNDRHGGEDARRAPLRRREERNDMTEVTAKPPLTPAQQRLNDLWEKHLREEFVTRDTEATLDTMVPDAYVNHVPVMTGGLGHPALRAFYSTLF